MGGSSLSTHFPGPDTLSLAVEEVGPTAVVEPIGEIDLATVGWVEAALDRICSDGMRRLVLDLQGVSFIDSAGLKAILRANERGRHEAFEVRVIKPCGAASRVFTLTGLHREINLVDSAAPAGAT